MSLIMVLIHMNIQLFLNDNKVVKSHTKLQMIKLLLCYLGNNSISTTSSFFIIFNYRNITIKLFSNSLTSNDFIII